MFGKTPVLTTLRFFAYGKSRAFLMTYADTLRVEEQGMAIGVDED